MTCGLVHASYSLPEWQAVKLTFFAPCTGNTRHSRLLAASWNILWVSKASEQTNHNTESREKRDLKIRGQTISSPIKLWVCE